MRFSPKLPAARRRAQRRATLAAAASVAVAVLASHSVSADTFVFVNNSDDELATATNYAPSPALFVAGNNFVYANGAAVNFSSSVLTGLTGEIDVGAGTLNVGSGVTDSSTGYLTAQGGSFNTSGAFFVGRNGQGFVNQTAGTLYAADFGIGFQGGGVYNLSGSAALVTKNELVVGGGFGQTLAPTSPSVLRMFGGTATTAGPISVAAAPSAVASVNITSGILATTSSLTLASGAGSVGTLNLTGGTITAANVSGGAGTSTINFNGGTLQASAASANFVTGVTGINIQGGGAIFNTSSFAVTLSQVLATTGPFDGGLTKLGTGVLTLTGANTYSGYTNIVAGALAIGADAAVNNGVGGYAFSGGNLRFNNYASNLNFSNGTVVLGANTGAASTLLGTVSGTAALSYAGPGTLVLGATNTFTGGTTVTAGILELAMPAALPGTAVVSSGATLAVPVGGASPFAQADVDARVAATTFNAGSYLGLDTAGGSFTDTSNLAGNGGLNKLGANTLTLTGTNTYLGPTAVNVGTLQVGNGGTTGTLGNGTTTVASGAVLAFNQSGALTVTGAVAGAGVTQQLGAGTLTFAAAFTQTNFFARAGTTTVGTTLATTNYLDVGDFAGDNAVLNVGPGAALTDSNDFNVGDTNGSNGVVNVTGGTVRVANTYVGKGNLTAGAANGVLNVSGGTYTQTSTTLFGVGGNVAIGNASVGVVNLTGGTIAVPATTQIGQYGTGQLSVSGTGGFNVTGGTTAIGRYLGGVGVVDVSGGGAFAYNVSSGGSLIVGEQGNGTLNVRGGLVSVATGNTTNGLRLTGTEATNQAATGILNLDGGVLAVPVLTHGTTGGLSLLNFNGGTLRATAAAVPTFVAAGLTQANVFNGGATIDTNGNSNITIAQPLVAPAGNGVVAVTLTGGGSGYLTAPVVVFSGGGGNGASGVATVSGGVVTGVTITNPGTGYTSAPNVTLIAGSNAGYSGAGGASVFTSIGANDPSGGLTKIGAGTLTLSAVATFGGPTNVAAGTLTFGPGAVGGGIRRQFLPGGLTIAAGASATLGVTVARTDRTLLVPTGLSNAGLLDLVNNDLDVVNGSLSDVTAQAAAGFAGGAWNGPTGLVSSKAAADTAHLTAVGVIANTVDGTTPLYPTFDGRSGLTATDVLARYTLYGDTNLDGVVNAGDYTRLDAGYVNALTGWFNGDFNYDGVVDGSDYSLADNAFNRQTNTIGVPASVVALPAAVVADAATVPEPAMIGLLAIAAGAMLGRRQGR